MDPTTILAGQTGPTGALSFQDFEALRKSLDAGYGTDVATLTGGAALRIQSLDTTLQATLMENKHFRFMNKVPRTKPNATVDEWTEQSDIGGFPGGTTNTETGAIGESTGSYARRVGLVKYLMVKRQVSFVQTLQSTITDSEAVEYSNGALQLMRDAEILCFEGDEAVVPTEWSGIYAQMAAGVTAGQVDSANIIDARATPLNAIDLIAQASQVIAGPGNYGTPTDIFTSQGVQSDLDISLDPAFRVSLTDVPGGGIQLGSPVRGIRTSYGDIATQPDVFVRDQDQMTPFELRYSAVAAAQVAIKPVSVAGANATDASSKFVTGQNGAYYYAVAGVNAAGQSAVTKSSAVTIAAGEKATVTITASAGGAETGYVIYRSRKGGTNATTDFREVARVAKSGATTVWVDLNNDIPGTTKAYVLNMSASAHAITFRQLLPMLKFPLYPTNAAVVPWAQLFFGFLRISKRRQHVVIKNILPSKATWTPFA